MGSYHEQEKNEKMMDEMGDLIFRIVHVLMLAGGLALSIYLAAQFAHM